MQQQRPKKTGDRPSESSPAPRRDEEIGNGPTNSRGHRYKSPPRSSNGVAPTIRQRGGPPHPKNMSPPRPRGNGNPTTHVASSRHKSNKKPPSASTSFFTAPTKAMSLEELEAGLHMRLNTRAYADAANWIHLSPALSEKYQLADVVRLVIAAQKWDLAGQLIRQLQLKSSPLLVTLFIKELVTSGQFQSAVRYAKELVPQFGHSEPVTLSSDALPRVVTWTPETLVQAMLRARQVKLALRYVKEFHLTETFSPRELIQQLVSQGHHLVAFKAVQEYHCHDTVPLASLIAAMLEAQSWADAINGLHLSKLATLNTRYSPTVLLTLMANAGDFIAALKYLRTFALVPIEVPASPSDVSPLLMHLIDAMVHHHEYYKAIKYAVKFNVSVHPSYTPQVLIPRAAASHQPQVAIYYITKWKLELEFSDLLTQMEKEKGHLKAQFRAFMTHRTKALSVQRLSQECLEPDMEMDMVSVMKTIVLSTTKEIIPPPRRNKEMEEEEEEFMLQPTLRRPTRPRPPLLSSSSSHPPSQSLSLPTSTAAHTPLASHGSDTTSFDFSSFSSQVNRAAMQPPPPMVPLGASHPSTTPPSPPSFFKPHEQAAAPLVRPPLPSFAASTAFAMPSFDISTLAMQFHNTSTLTPPGYGPGVTAGASAGTEAGLFVPPVGGRRVPTPASTTPALYNLFPPRNP